MNNEILYNKIVIHADKHKIMIKITIIKIISIKDNIQLGNEVHT